MNTTRSILGIGLAIIAVGVMASSRPAAAQSPLLTHPAQVRPLFGDWNHGSDQGRNYDRDRDQDRNRDGDRDRRRAEQAQRDAGRARREAEIRRAQWLRDHRRDGDRGRGRDDARRDWQRDDR